MEVAIVVELSVAAVPLGKIPKSFSARLPH
jgi:hypothetical protein